jgi:hypothetical protein
MSPLAITAAAAAILALSLAIGRFIAVGEREEDAPIQHATGSFTNGDEISNHSGAST